METEWKTVTSIEIVMKEKETGIAKMTENGTEDAETIETEIAAAKAVETVIVITAENRKWTVAAEDLKPDHLLRLMIIADAVNEKIFWNRSSKYKPFPCNRMRKGKTVGVQCLPFYFCSRIFIV